MDPVRVGFCLLLIIWFPRCCWQSKQDHDNLLPKEKESGAVKRTEPEQWGVKTLEDLKNPGVVSLVETWTNSHRGGYCLECYKNVKKGLTLYRARIGFEYDSKALLVVDVISCGSDLLNSITIVPRRIKTSQIILLFEDGTCEMNISNFKKNQLVRTTEPCPPRNKRGRQKNGNGYINSWMVSKE